MIAWRQSLCFRWRSASVPARMSPTTGRICWTSPNAVPPASPMSLRACVGRALAKEEVALENGSKLVAAGWPRQPLAGGFELPSLDVLDAARKSGKSTWGADRCRAPRRGRGICLLPRPGERPTPLRAPVPVPAWACLAAGVLQASTRETALSQHCLCGQRVEKTLSERGDRDAISATLAAYLVPPIPPLLPWTLSRRRDLRCSSRLTRTGRLAARHRRWWLGETSARRCAQPRMRLWLDHAGPGASANRPVQRGGEKTAAIAGQLFSPGGGIVRAFGGTPRERSSLRGARPIARGRPVP